MSSLTPQMDAALGAFKAVVTLFLKVELPGHTIRLLPGAGAVAWGEEVYSSIDTTFGTLSAIDEIEDGTGDQAPAVGFTMLPPSNSSAAELASAAFQGSPVYVWLAAIHPTTGLLIPDPYLLFSGFVDQPTVTGGKGKRQVDFDCVSMFDRLLEPDEGSRLSDAFHRLVWPGEAGLANVTGIEKSIYWGTTDPNPGSISTGLSGGIGEIANRYNIQAN